MKIRDIALNDFRLFYGRHEINFSIKNDKHITIFVGENGAGKTTLLNAIYWAFTGNFTKQMTRASDGSINVINKDARKEGRRECSVQVTFLDETSTYVLNRTYTDSGNTMLSLHVVSQDGVSRPIAPTLAQGHLEKFLPSQLANWFIFDGEAMDQIQLNGSPNFKKDLQKTFGFSHMNLLIEQLRAMEREYAKQESKAINDTEVSSVNDLVEQYEKAIDIFKEEIAKRDDEIENEEKLESAYFQQLRALPQSDALTGNIERETRLAKEKSQRMAGLEHRRKQLLIDDGPKFLLSKLCESLEGKLQIKEEKQSLPAPFGDRLIADIFSMNECICGRPVYAGSTEAVKLIALAERASTSQFTQRIATIRSALTGHATASAKYTDNMQQLDESIEILVSEINEHRTTIKSHEEEMAGIPIAKIQELDAKRNAAKANASRAREARGILKARLEDARSKHSNAKINLDSLLSKKNKGTQISKDRKEVAELYEYVTSQFARQEKEVLHAISSELSNVMTKYFTKHYTASVNPENYAVKTLDESGAEVALSTGEGYLLKFAVIASLVGLAGSKNRNSSINWISSPIVAPLIFDAPFSVNDATYRKNIAKNLSEQASQLIILFDSDKWNAGMAAELGNRVGKYYTLISRARGQSKDISKTMNINGRIIALNEYEGERDESVCIEQSIV
jgi:DNA sulfur modification protein DndD